MAVTQFLTPTSLYRINTKVLSSVQGSFPVLLIKLWDIERGWEIELDRKYHAIHLSPRLHRYFLAVLEARKFKIKGQQVWLSGDSPVCASKVPCTVFLCGKRAQKVFKLCLLAPFARELPQSPAC